MLRECLHLGIDSVVKISKATAKQLLCIAAACL